MGERERVKKMTKSSIKAQSVRVPDTKYLQDYWRRAERSNR